MEKGGVKNEGKGLGILFKRSLDEQDKKEPMPEPSGSISQCSADNCSGGLVKLSGWQSQQTMFLNSASNCHALQVLCFQRPSYFQTPSTEVTHQE